MVFDEETDSDDVFVDPEVVPESDSEPDVQIIHPNIGGVKQPEEAVKKEPDSPRGPVLQPPSPLGVPISGGGVKKEEPLGPMPFMELHVPDGTPRDQRIRLFAQKWIEILEPPLNYRNRFANDEVYNPDLVKDFIKLRLHTLFNNWNIQNKPAFNVKPKQFVRGLLTDRLKFFNLAGGTHDAATGSVEDNAMNLRMTGFEIPINARGNVDNRKSQVIFKGENYNTFHAIFESLADQYEGEFYAPGLEHDLTGNPGFNAMQETEKEPDKVSLPPPLESIPEFAQTEQERQDAEYLASEAYQHSARQVQNQTIFKEEAGWPFFLAIGIFILILWALISRRRQRE